MPQTQAWMMPGWAIDLEEPDPVQARNAVILLLSRDILLLAGISSNPYTPRMMLYDVSYCLWNCWNIWHAPMHWHCSDQDSFVSQLKDLRLQALMTRATPWWRSQPQNAPERKCHCPLEGLTCQGKLSYNQLQPFCQAVPRLWMDRFWRLWKSYG